jgi:VWFA-related protein
MITANGIVFMPFRRKTLAIALLMALSARPCRPQDPPPAPAAGDKKNEPEVSSHDTPTTFSARTNLVMVPVVVRDRAGKTVSTLRQEDFTLFDKGKPQIISKFSVEKAGGSAIQLPLPSDAGGDGKPATPLVPLATRSVAYLFDDVNTTFADLAMVRDAARKQIKETLQPSDRIAIFTTSGQNMLDFGDDRQAIENTLLQLRPQAKNREMSPCPNISYYLADLIANKNDTMALSTAAQDALKCLPGNPPLSEAEQVARSRAYQVLAEGDYGTRLALSVLKATVRRLSAMPGQRILALVSSGFLVLDTYRSDETDIVDHAIRANVTINTLDARGLPGIPGFDMSQSRGPSPAGMRYLQESALAEGEVLGELADATGGTWFHNRNDLTQGFLMLATAPEYTYVLGFSPQNLRYNGSYHGLKVTLKTPAGFSLQARRGYYAPKHQADPAEQAKEEIREALFSREEMRAIPLSLQTQFFKPNDVSAKLSVLAHLDLKAIQFRKTEGRNRNTLTVVSAIFDRNGNMIDATQKRIEMFLRDETFAAHLARGVTVKTSFDVTPGNYVIRLVVRDSEGQTMTAQNGIVQIP